MRNLVAVCIYTLTLTATCLTPCVTAQSDTTDTIDLGDTQSPDFNASAYLNPDYPLPLDENGNVPTTWFYAPGYWWVVRCWVQPAYNATEGTPPIAFGGTNQQCPPGVWLNWATDSAPPVKVKEQTVFKTGVVLTINQSLFTLDVNNGRGFYIPHFAMYGCDVADFHEGFACVPSVDSQSDYMKIRTIVPPSRTTENLAQYQFDGLLSMPVGTFMVTSNVQFFDADGTQYILALGSQTESESESLSAGVIAGIVIACLLFVAVVATCAYFFYRFTQERSKVKALRPREYPKNMAAPTADINDFDELEAMHSIPAKRFIALEKLGYGAFGEVFKGALFNSDNTAALCAIKNLKEEHRETLAEKFLAEAELMKTLRHPNVVHMIGVSGVDEEERTEICILMEYLPNGDLKHYISNPANQVAITNAERLWYAWQLAMGCEYIAAKNLVHRDLAARNCLLGNLGPDGYHFCKISDFGLARVTEGEDQEYIMEGGGLLPVRWMAVESITERQFSEASDVWAYAVMIWEVFSNGKVPYCDTQSYNLAASIADGLRLEKPETCNREVYRLLASCWQRNPEDRPSFSTLVTEFAALYCSGRGDLESPSGELLALAAKKNHIFMQDEKHDKLAAEEHLTGQYVDAHDIESGRYVDMELRRQQSDLRKSSSLSRSTGGSQKTMKTEDLLSARQVNNAAIGVRDGPESEYTNISADRCTGVEVVASDQAAHMVSPRQQSKPEVEEGYTYLSAEPRVDYYNGRDTHRNRADSAAIMMEDDANVRRTPIPEKYSDLDLSPTMV
ncbi:TK protein kinase [Sphaeroforma arctica JP610]|uniref:TK protein kinase n=1 Tax=Sphaeroforma arctica JP610 TaxID=667725 RepID=A0A0L0FX16_9EUKA|nr:TK protein kinase [Sphaeroforma arctica JP610]KNC80503.1 TK protein kinase [Sphaeroforma arctica JP610]|eukprot:XP_014154405.1 TK protein kinase [Sphaeroforma arctica JP610]